MSRELMAGVIGLGFGANHARVLSEIEGVNLVAVCDANPRRLAVIGRGRTLRTYTDYHAMLREERLEALVIAVPTQLHEEVALASIAARVPALVEKPLAPSRQEGLRLAQAASQAGVALMAGHIECFNPAVQELARRLRSGEAGRVLEVTARRAGPFAARTRDVGVIPDLAFHDIYVMRYVLGADVDSVYAEAQFGVRTAFDDSLHGLLRFAPVGDQPGAVASLEANWLTPRKVRELTVLCEHGLYVVDYLAQTLELHQSVSEGGTSSGPTWSTLANLRGSEPGPVVRLPVEAREPLAQELTAFVTAVRDGTPMPVTVADALAALAVADALAEPARTGLPVRPAGAGQ